jgi:hypothetical protein
MADLPVFPIEPDGITDLVKCVGLTPMCCSVFPIEPDGITDLVKCVGLTPMCCSFLKFGDATPLSSFKRLVMPMFLI